MRTGTFGKSPSPHPASGPVFGFREFRANKYLSPSAFVAGRRTGLASVEGAANESLQARHEPLIAQRTPRPKVTPKRPHRPFVLLLREQPPPVPHLDLRRPPYALPRRTVFYTYGFGMCQSSLSPALLVPLPGPLVTRRVLERQLDVRQQVFHPRCRLGDRVPCRRGFRRPPLAFAGKNLGNRLSIRRFKQHGLADCTPRGIG